MPSSQPVVPVQLSFQTNYGLIYSVECKEVLSSGIVVGQKVEYKRNMVKWKSVHSEGVSR